ncbi:T9SS type A sorting domain-containing protein, partial [bacterium]|nr:T9SS type A sorting domain-containing protein [bacterium]
PENTNSNISISPNPFIDNFSINMPDGVSKLDIFDLTGKIIYHNDFLNQKSEVIDLSGKQSGLYILKLIGNQINYQEKIIKK